MTKLNISTPRRFRTGSVDGLSQSSDAQLVTQVARYSEAALAEIYRRHAGAVYGLAHRVLRNPSEAQDVTQEIFVTLWQHPERFDPSRGSLRSFLLAQAHGRAVDAVRSLTARQRREVQEAQRTASTHYDIEREAWDLVLEDKVSRALDELPRGEREAIELAYFEGYSYVEVARTLGEPEGTTKSRIRRGMQRMRVALVDAGIEGVEA